MCGVHGELPLPVERSFGALVRMVEPFKDPGPRTPPGPCHWNHDAERPGDDERPKGRQAENAAGRACSGGTARSVGAGIETCGLGFVTEGPSHIRAPIRYPARCPDTDDATGG
ncbi:hypothetical protein GCM10023193_07350 [Planotetraspora kaengkrachanensis]